MFHRCQSVVSILVRCWQKCLNVTVVSEAGIGSELASGMEQQPGRDEEEQTPRGKEQLSASHAAEDGGGGEGAVGGEVEGARPEQWPTPVFSHIVSEGEEAVTPVLETRIRLGAARENTPGQVTRGHVAAFEEDGEEEERPATWRRKVRGGRPLRPAICREAPGPSTQLHDTDDEESEEEWSDAVHSQPSRPRTPERRRAREPILREQVEANTETLNHLRRLLEQYVRQGDEARAQAPAPASPDPATATSSPQLAPRDGAHAPALAPASPDPVTATSGPHPPPPTPLQTERRTVAPIKLKGYNGRTDLETYIAQVEAVARGNRWSSMDTANAVVGALEGDGRKVLRDVPQAEQNNWERVVAAMRLRFGTYAIEEEARTQMARRHRGASETVGWYGAELKTLAYTGWPTASEAHRDDILLRAFIEGLRPIALRDHVRLQRCGSMEEALFEANEADRVIRERPLPPRTDSPTRPRARGVMYEEWQLEEEACRGVTSLVCWRCREIGHRVAECDAPAPRGRPPCARCGVIGHTAPDCLKPRTPSPALNIQGRAK